MSVQVFNTQSNMNKPLRMWGLTGFQIISIGMSMLLMFAFINFLALIIIPLVAIPARVIAKHDRKGHPDFVSSWFVKMYMKRKFVDKNNLLNHL